MRQLERVRRVLRQDAARIAHEILDWAEHKGGDLNQFVTIPQSAFVGTLIESLILAAIGGAIGAAATYLVFDGFTSSTLGESFTQVVFSFKLSPQLIGQGVGLALVVGLIGGLFPAIRAARMPIVAGLYG